jgi:phospholipid/cholesterol/gamma-HCH transport system ATP-binding protein
MESADNVPVLEIREVSKSFDQHVVLKGINLSVLPGENLVVLGKSGSGKSTLIKCLVGLMDTDEGSIYIKGKDISKASYRELNEMRVNVGFLFQGAALYDSMTVRENLAFPLKHHKRRMSEGELDALIRETLDNVGLADAMDKMPAELSGGMQKRVGLARTLVLHPAIMLYDEPTTGLDTATAKEISQLILDMQRKYKISSIIITHDMTCAKMTADRIVMLREGIVVAEGTYAELERMEDEWIKSFFS